MTADVQKLFNITSTNVHDFLLVMYLQLMVINIVLNIVYILLLSN